MLTTNRSTRRNKIAHEDVCQVPALCAVITSCTLQKGCALRQASLALSCFYSPSLGLDWHRVHGPMSSHAGAAQLEHRGTASHELQGGNSFLTVALHLLAPEFILLTCYNNIVMLLESQCQNYAAELLELQWLGWCCVLPCSVHIWAVMEEVFYEEGATELHLECSGAVGKCYLLLVSKIFIYSVPLIV